MPQKHDLGRIKAARAQQQPAKHTKTGLERYAQRLVSLGLASHAILSYRPSRREDA